MKRFDVAIVGSGFAGTILARALTRCGRKVVLLERGRHPRFAVGESSTPLAAIALERLAARYELPDLDHFAAYGRWMAEYPEVRRGLKRGFTFYSHCAGELLQPLPESRLLVAASPDDAVADSHWLRADVDRFLVDRALEEGIEYRDRCVVASVDEVASGLRVRGTSEDRRFEIVAGFAVDASGPAGVVARAMGSEAISQPARFHSGVVFSHFEGVRPLAEIWRDQGAVAETGPYPDEAAAVHHILDDGWIYVLPFDHDCVSAGLVFDRRSESIDPEAAWDEALAKYPTLGLQFGGARPLRPLKSISRLQFRLSHAMGPRWAALPHVYAFFDPMFSTGIAWSLLGVERLAALLSTEGAPDSEGLHAYGLLLQAEAAQMERLLYGAHLARRDFGLYAAHSHLYFALVSYEEVRQRIVEDEVKGAPHAFLGAGDPWAESLLTQAVARLERLRSAGEAGVTSDSDYESWVADSIASRNVAGLADPERRNLYPVDLSLLVQRAGLVGITSAEMRRLMPRLRGRRR